MWVSVRLTRLRYMLMLLIALALATQLAACGDKEPDQRKAFIQFLQTTVLPGGERLPALSDVQKQQFGPYANDYQILLTFTQQFTHAVNTGLAPVLDIISQIRIPQDYLTRRGDLQQAAGALNLLGPQMAGMQRQAENGRAGLKQPDDLKAVYNQAYDKLVTQAIAKVTPVVTYAATLSATLVQVGNFLSMQGNQVTFGPTSIMFPTRIQATQYNELMKGLTSQHEQLVQAQNDAGALLP
ncbi:DUF3053 domain-containing protein [Martelella alba]|uniref:DUF3053 domain-containing protein n=1 Tax=Martelella alba TaxID=2590451 RepID=A0ABY2SN03_9HYPH|nr:DUF3053 domain-containing protein [Martelella alba]TKI07267.1 DUF3053 domain-containing protein [Martelella alba]